MKQFLNTLIWASSIGVVLGAYVTQIPTLVTIATALYWIVSILLPIVLLLLAVCFSGCSRTNKTRILSKY